jgi:hypothetical protein
MTKRFHHFHQAAKVALFVAVLAVAPRLANAQTPRCNGLNGSYAFTFSGMAIFPGFTTPLPFSGVGIQTFDGTGKFTATESANFGGLFAVKSAAFSGTYTINSDCTGTMTAKFPDGTSGHQDFVVADAGKTMYAVGTDTVAPGTSLSTIFTKMPITW